MQYRLPGRAAGALCIALMALMMTACGGGSREAGDPATANTVGATTNPTGPVNVTVGGSQAVSFTFTTSDGKPATGLSITSGLSPLPAGWTSASPSFSCATVDGGTGCKLNLTYAPSVATAESTLTLAYRYVDSAGNTQSATTSIAYASNEATVLAARAYVLNFSNDSITQCIVGDDGSFSDCKDSGASGFRHGSELAISGTTAYILDSYEPKVVQCSIGSDGSFGDCKNSGIIWPTDAGRFAANESHLYVTHFDGLVTLCAIGGDGSLSHCVDSGADFPLGVIHIALNGSNAYVIGTSAVNQCTMRDDGVFESCRDIENPMLNGSRGMAFHGSNAYLVNYTNSTVIHCAVDSDGWLSGCKNAGVASLSGPNGISVHGSGVYIANYNNHSVTRCEIGSGGTLADCKNPGATLLDSPMSVQFKLSTPLPESPV